MAAPDSHETDQISKIDGPNEAESASDTAPPAPTAAPPRRKRGGFLSRLFGSAVILLITLGVAGYGALIFRDVDPNVGAAATYVDQGLVEAKSALDQAQTTISRLMGDSPAPASSKVTTRRSATAAQPQQPPAPAERPEAVAEPSSPAPLEAAKDSAVAGADVPEPPRKPAEMAQETAPAPQTLPAPVAPAPESLAQELAKAPEPVAAAPAQPLPAQAPASPSGGIETAGPDGFTDRDLISALEGRIDALSDEISALREKLAAPKNESRVAPEAEAPRPIPAPVAVAPVADSAATTVVVAFALLRELESGRPFTDEIAALSRLSVEPAPASILVESANKGVPTGAQLREIFAPIAKRLKAEEAHAQPHAEGGDIAGHLLEGASKLVKVRPAGHAEAESLDGKIEKVEAALSRNDIAGAEAAFESLPETARAQAREFAEALHLRIETAKAADDLLHRALAALGAKK
ncbi:MAG: hypothetical protein CTY15_00390 [Methylocystis sp.]|nr:MAG: hypothetical protein CTY15_00390 [Methylocystis sp.]